MTISSLGDWGWAQAARSAEHFGAAVHGLRWRGAPRLRCTHWAVTAQIPRTPSQPRRTHTSP